MTNNKPIFYFGTTILILTLLATVAGSTPQNYFLDDHIPQFIFAQEDEGEEKEEEEEPEEESKEEEEEEEEQESGSEEEGEQQPEEEPTAEEQTNVSVVTNETIQETAQQIIEKELALAGITSPNETPPVSTPPPEETISPPPQPVTNEMQFDATCNCTTMKPTQQPVMQPVSPQQQNNVIQQIPLTAANILSQKSLGKVIDPIYTSYYTVANLFDSKTDDTSFWSQAGNSGFSIRLDGTLNDYRVCSIELNNIPNPKNVPFILDVGTSQNYTGILNQVNQRIQFDSCITNMNQIVMIFNKGNPQSEDFISIGEIKLFGSKLGAVTPAAATASSTPTTTMSPSQQLEQPYKNATKVNISNADAQIDIKNSTITFKFDPSAAQATGYSVITIPDTRVIK